MTITAMLDNGNSVFYTPKDKKVHAETVREFHARMDAMSITTTFHPKFSILTLASFRESYLN